MAASWQAVSALLHPTLASQLPAPPSRLSTYTALSPPPITLPPAQVMYAEPLSARPMRPAGELLPGEEAGASAGGVASAGSAGGYLPATGGAGSAEENVAAAAAAAAVAGMAHTFMASPPEATCSTSMQLHTPMTGASRWMDGGCVGWKRLAGTQWWAVEVANCGVQPRVRTASCCCACCLQDSAFHVHSMHWVTQQAMGGTCHPTHAPSQQPHLPALTSPSSSPHLSRRRVHCGCAAEQLQHGVGRAQPHVARRRRPARPPQRRALCPLLAPAPWHGRRPARRRRPGSGAEQPSHHGSAGGRGRGWWRVVVVGGGGGWCCWVLLVLWIRCCVLLRLLVVMLGGRRCLCECLWGPRSCLQASRTHAFLLLFCLLKEPPLMCIASPRRCHCRRMGTCTRRCTLQAAAWWALP